MTMKSIYLALAVLWVALFHSAIVSAQATINVFSPVVNLNQQGVEYRAAYVPDDGNKPSRFRQRVHYQRPINDNLRWRTVVQGSDTINQDFDLEFYQAELQWQIRNNNEHGFDSAFRFDARISEDGVNPNRVGINWTNQFNFAERWQARAIFLAARDIGEHKRSGVLIRTWSQLRYRLLNGSSIALEMFNSYGRTPSFGSFDKQRHQVGTLYSGSFANGLNYNLGVLFGASDAATDMDLRFFLSKNF